MEKILLKKYEQKKEIFDLFSQSWQKKHFSKQLLLIEHFQEKHFQWAKQKKKDTILNLEK
jgi:hypothetical protein